MSQYAEATPNGVNIMTRTDAGIYEHVSLITYDDAVKRLDTGEYDDLLDFAFAIHGAVSEAGEKGWFDFTDDHHVAMWRWLIAAVFFVTMKRENGTTLITEQDGTSSHVALYSNGSVAMPVYPVAERLAMANNIEGGLIERYGVEKGTERAIIFYSAMLDTESGELTTFGREALAELHDHFISELEEHGLPETPVAH